MNPKPAIIATALSTGVIAASLIAGCAGYSGQPHTGDGTFVDTSQGFFPLRVPGFRIEFDEFDLSENYQAEYRVSKLPCLAEQDRNIELFIVDGENWRKALQECQAKVKVEIRDSSRKVVMTLDKPLKELIWAMDGSKVYGYDQGNFLDAGADGEFTLSLMYQGDDRLRTKGFLRIDCGGSI